MKFAKSKFGKAFPDQLNKVSFKSGSFHKGKGKYGGAKDDPFDWTSSLGESEFRDENSTSLLSSWTKAFFLIVLIIIFSGFLIRLFHLQVALGSDNRQLADSNRIQVKVIHAPRGVIYDRNGKILAQNEPGFRLLDASGAAHAKYLSRDEALAMEVNNDPNFKNLEIDSIRTYPYGEKTAHILGYVGEISEDELKNPNFSGYKGGDKVGRSGVEEVYEKVLRGVDGGEVIEVDAQGKEVRTLRRTEPIPGQNLYLSIDADLQSLAFDQLKIGVTKASSCCGSLIAEDPNNGEVLALVSYPSFDPKNIGDALMNPNEPLLNRVIGGTYPPGSTFKIASALAGLNSGKITSQTKIEDTGVMNLGPYTFANWYFTEYGRKEEGGVDVIKALQRSNDIFFYQLGVQTGEGVLADTAKSLGLGKKVGIDIPGEVAGLIPTDDWKEKNVGVVWYPGDTLHMAIGQGYVLTTPIQINNLVSTIASDGHQYPAHLALKITTPSGFKIKNFHYDPINITQFKESDIALVRKGLEEVPENGGTAWPFFTFPIPTAGKTGTAEFGDGTKTHAWYTSYAPAQNPKIAMTVMVEGGGEGSSISGPIAKEVYRWYFSPDKKNLLKDIYPIATESAKILGE